MQRSWSPGNRAAYLVFGQLRGNLHRGRHRVALDEVRLQLRLRTNVGNHLWAKGGRGTRGWRMLVSSVGLFDPPPARLVLGKKKNFPDNRINFIRFEKPARRGRFSVDNIRTLR